MLEAQVQMHVHSQEDNNVTNSLQEPFHVLEELIFITGENNLGRDMHVHVS